MSKGEVKVLSSLTLVPPSAHFSFLFPVQKGNKQVLGTRVGAWESEKRKQVDTQSKLSEGPPGLSLSLSVLCSSHQLWTRKGRGGAVGLIHEMEEG